VPQHRAEAEVGERVAECGKLPVEYADDFRPIGMEEKVAQAEIAMGDRHPSVVRRQVPWQPFGDRLEDADPLARRFPQLLRPARELPLEIIARPPEIGEPDFFRPDGMQLRHGFGHGEIDLTAPLRRQARQGAVVEDAPLQPLHQVEGRAEQLLVLVVEHRARNRDIGGGQRLDDAVLAVDGMRAAQDRPGRLLAQHHAAPAEIDEIGGVGLAATDPLQRQLARTEA